MLEEHEVASHIAYKQRYLNLYKQRYLILMVLWVHCILIQWTHRTIRMDIKTQDCVD